jgi:Zn-dependent protease with chaperone function
MALGGRSRSGYNRGMQERLRRSFPDIDPRAWEHPADRAALGVLRQAGDLSRMGELLVGLTQERQMRLWHLGSAVRVSERQLRHLHDLSVDVCGILDVNPVPELFVMQQPLLNAGALGAKNPFIVLTSAAVSGLSDAETRAMIGHELGHIKSGHVTLKTILALLMRLAAGAVGGAVPELVLRGLLIALMEWDRKSELSADRAGLLACQDLQAAQNLLLRTAGGTLEGLDVEAFLSQAEEYEKSPDIVDSVYKLLQQAGQSHPMTAVRARELGTWADQGAYRSILEGTYPRAGDVRPDVNAEFGKARDQYRDDMASSQDPLAKLVSSLGKGLDDAGRQAQRFIDELFGRSGT